MNRNVWACIVLGTVLTISGCIGGEPEPLPPDAQGSGGQVSTAEGTDTPPAAVEAQPMPSVGGPEEKVPPSDVVPQLISPQQAQPELAQPGVGVKGSGYGGGIITEPVSVYFRAREATAFNIQIPHGLKMFKATNDRYPRDWEEFDREILQPAAIQLPELPAGKKYIFDSESGQLMVQTIQ